MTAKAGSIAVRGALLIALLIVCHAARAEQNCLAAPNGHNPPGSHWHYRTDPVTQAKCWYLRTDGQVMQKPAGQGKLAAAVAARRPVAANPKTVLDQAAPGADNVAWPDPPSQAGADKVAWPSPHHPSPAETDNVVWPDPPPLPGGPPQRTAASRASEQRANQAQEVPAAAANPDKENDAGIDRRAAEPIERAAPRREIPGGLLLAFLIGLLIVGIFMRRVVRTTFARRRTIYLDRQQPIRTISGASERREPKLVVQQADLAPGLPSNEPMEHEVREALGKLLRVLDPQSA